MVIQATDQAGTMRATAALVNATAADVPNAVGDSNVDGQVDAQDEALLVEHIAGWI